MPSLFDMVTSTVPAECAGAETVTELGPAPPIMGALAPPNVMVAPEFTLAPVNITAFPPAVGPALGLTFVSVGAFV